MHHNCGHGPTYMQTHTRTLVHTHTGNGQTVEQYLVVDLQSPAEQSLSCLFNTVSVVHSTLVVLYRSLLAAICTAPNTLLPFRSVCSSILRVGEILAGF